MNILIIEDNPDIVANREALEMEVWNGEPPLSDALRSHIHALRQAVDKAFPQLPPMLVTVAGVGYRLVNANAAA